MKKLILVAFIAGTVGFVAGNAFWYLASPLWIDQVVDEGISQSETARILARGTFSDADAAHRGRGTATIFEGTDGRHTLRLSDFEVTNGPDLEVWLVAAENVTASSDVTGSEWLALGQLKGNIGDQNYDIPAGTDLSKYNSVVIWCEQFGVLFSPASLLR
ncbi:DM13 domain-containing protein [Pelagibius sp.]|uniref:DM13 domain-containing protein n=1 Tax=Pelagibius sp. TaxID=1931238 RepID=UPI003B5051D6